MTKRDLLDAPDRSAREKVEQRLSKMIWSALIVFIFTSPGFFSAWRDLQTLYYLFMICAPITYAAFAYEIYMTWRIKQWFDQTGVQSFDEVSKKLNG